MQNGGRYDAMRETMGRWCHVDKKLKNTKVKMQSLFFNSGEITSKNYFLIEEYFLSV